MRQLAFRKMSIYFLKRASDSFQYSPGSQCQPVIMDTELEASMLPLRGIDRIH